MGLIGLHMEGTPKKLIQNIDSARAIGCTIVQIFVHPHSSYIEYYEPFVQHNQLAIVVHADYRTNLAKPLDETSNIQYFIDEIKLSHHINAFAIIVHLGKQLGLTKEEALNNMLINLIHVHTQTKSTPIKILLETSSGQGSEMCYQLDDLAKFFAKLINHRDKSFANRFGICLDTCHVFAAGYDISHVSRAKQFLSEFDSKIGLEHIKVVHLNDSKRQLGSRVDRHQSLLKGHIGSGIKYMAKFFSHSNVPLVLETPMSGHVEEMKYLKKVRDS